MFGMINKISQMSLSDLRLEYEKSDNQTVKKIIKKRILEQEKYEKRTQKESDKYLDEIIRMKEESMKKKKHQDFVEIYSQRGKMEKYWEKNQETKKIDPKFKMELEKDTCNNKLMERLNSELDFRLNEKKKIMGKKRIIKPYDESDNDGNYKNFDRYVIPKANDFTYTGSF